jgi:hypothetical protein
MSTITIEAKVVGRRSPLVRDWKISLPPEWGTAESHLTLQDLITRIVQVEVEGFETRQEARRLERVLSTVQIAEGVVQGKVEMGGQELEQAVDIQVAIQIALQAFEDGLYYVFVDEVQYERLEDEVVLKADSQVLFLRLVALVGG